MSVVAAHGLFWLHASLHACLLFSLSSNWISPKFALCCETSGNNEIKIGILWMAKLFSSLLAWQHQRECITHGIGRFCEITDSNLMLFAYMVLVTSAGMIKRTFLLNFWQISRTKKNWFSATLGTFIRRPHGVIPLHLWFMHHQIARLPRNLWHVRRHFHFISAQGFMSRVGGKWNELNC